MRENAQKGKKQIEKKVKPRPVFRFKTQLKIVLGVFLIALLAAGFFYGRQYYRKITEAQYRAFSALVSDEIASCAELAVLKYGYSEIVSLRKTAFMGLAKSFSLVRFSGSVRAGIADMSLTDVRVSFDRKNVFVSLPPSVILSNSIVSQEVFDEMQSVFIPITTGEVFAEIDAAREKKLFALTESGFLREAQERAEQLVMRVLSAMGFENISITSRQT